MKTLITSDPSSWHERAVAIGIIIATLIVLAILASTAHAGAAPVCPTPTAIRLQTFDAAPTAICRTYAWTCTQYRSTFGVRYCVAYAFRCAKYAHAGKIAGLSQPVAGNKGGCALGNQWTRLDCTVTYFTPGYVSGECVGGFWFRRERTSKTWVLDQLARVTACEVEDDQLTGVQGFRFRISR
jgi:hypothetical protein